eukprot:394299-Rhodomonas_salina.2
MHRAFALAVLCTTRQRQYKRAPRTADLYQAKSTGRTVAPLCRVLVVFDGHVRCRLLTDHSSLRYQDVVVVYIVVACVAHGSNMQEQHTAGAYRISGLRRVGEVSELELECRRLRGGGGWGRKERRRRKNEEDGVGGRGAGQGKDEEGAEEASMSKSLKGTCRWCDRAQQQSTAAAAKQQRSSSKAAAAKQQQQSSSSKAKQQSKVAKQSKAAKQEHT